MKRKIAIILGTIMTLSSTQLSLASNIQTNNMFSQDVLQEQKIKTSDMKTNINPEEYMNLVDGSVSLATPGLYPTGVSYPKTSYTVYEESIYDTSNQHKLSRKDTITYKRHSSVASVSFINVNSSLDRTITSTTNVLLNASNFESGTITELKKLYNVPEGSVINTDLVVSLTNVAPNDIKKFKNLQAVSTYTYYRTKDSHKLYNKQELNGLFADPSKIKVISGLSVENSSDLSDFTDLKIYSGFIKYINSNMQGIDKLQIRNGFLIDDKTTLIKSDVNARYLFLDYAIFDHTESNSYSFNNVEAIWARNSRLYTDVRLHQLYYPKLKQLFIDGADSGYRNNIEVDLIENYLHSSSIDTLEDLFVVSTRDSDDDSSYGIDLKITEKLANLKNFVSTGNRALNIINAENIYTSSRLKVFVTNAKLDNINNLQGLSNNIETLVLTGYPAGSSSIEITDLTNISNKTNLKKLAIPNTKITDWSNLNRLTSLEYLDITSNNITNLNISSLSKLNVLKTSKTNISNYNNIPLKNSGSLYVEFANPVNVSSLPNHYTWYIDKDGNTSASTSATYSTLTGYPNRALINETTLKVKKGSEERTNAVMGETGLTVEFTLKSSKYPDFKGSPSNADIEFLVNDKTYKTVKSKGVGNTVTFELDESFWEKVTYGTNKIGIKYSGGDTVQGTRLEASQGSINLEISKGKLSFEPIIYTKLFDNTTEAIIEDIKFNGLLSGDNLELGVDYNITSAKYDNANVGEDKDVTVTIELLNTPLANKYELTETEKIVKGSILPNDSVITNVKIKNDDRKETTNFDYNDIMVIEAIVKLPTEEYNTKGNNRLVLMYEDEEIATSNIGVQLNKPTVLKLNLNDSTLKAGNISNLKLVYKGSNNLNSSEYKLPTINLKGIDIKGTVNASVEYNGTDTYEIQVNDFSLKDKEESVSNITGNVTVRLENSDVGMYDAFEVLSYELTGEGSHKYVLNTDDLTGNININKKEIEISSAIIEDKAYDGTNNAIISDVTFNGLANSEQLDKGVDYAVEATFDDENVGMDKSVSININLLDTEKANNYTLKTNIFETTGNITKGASTIDGIKITNGQDEETTVFSFKDSLKVTGTPKASKLAKESDKMELLLNNEVIGTQIVSENSEAQFDVILDDLDIGKGTYELKLRYSGNDNLSSTEISLGNITIKPIELTATIEETFTYNGKNSFSVNLNNLKDKENRYILQDITGTATVTLNSENVGEYTTFTVESVELSGDKANRYDIVNDEDLTGTINIEPKEISIQSANVENKGYNGTNTANVTSIAFNDLLDKDNLIKDVDYNVVANFDNENIGIDKLVYINVDLLDTENANNYILIDNHFETTGNITEAGSTIENVKITNGQNEITRQFSLDDTLKVTATPKIQQTNTFSNNVDKMELLLNDKVIETKDAKENNQVQFNISLEDLKIEKGTYKLSLKYTGNSNLSSSSTELGEIVVTPLKADLDIKQNNTIFSGQTLKELKLDYKATYKDKEIPGNLEINEDLEKILEPGKHKIKVTFVPQDNEKFENTTKEIEIDVTQQENENNSGGNNNGGNGNNGNNGGGNGSPIEKPGDKNENDKDSEKDKENNNNNDKENENENNKDEDKNEGNQEDIEFDDLDDNHFAKDEIQDLVKKGIVKGYNGLIRPDEPITRAEFAVLLNNTCNYLNIDASNLSEETYIDVAKDKYYYSDIYKATFLDTMVGYNDSTFKPENSLVREEAVVSIHKLISVCNIDIALSTPTEFDDYKKISTWAKPYFDELNAKGIVKGNNKSFNPKEQITRAEAFVLIYNVINS